MCATAEYIKSRQPALVSIVAMGILSQQQAPEDERNCSAVLS